MSVKGGGIPNRYFGGLRERSLVPLTASDRRKAGRKRRRESVDGFKKMVPMPVGIKTQTQEEKMKKFLVVLLSLGLIVAFGMTASAADVKFGGGYYVVGVYQDNPTLGENSYSHAFFYQRVRLQPVFQIAEGLTFTARMDALEKQWGNTNWKGGTDDTTSSRRNQVLVAPAAGQKIQESFEFERGYVTFMTGIGQFQVGYQNVDDWGTDFSDYSNSRPRIAYATKLGPVTLALTYEKVYETDTAGSTPALYTNYVDADKDTYAVSGTYNGKGLEAGLLYKYYAFNNTRPAGLKTQMNLIAPYVKATFGPVYIEGEAQYWFGKAAVFEAPAPATPDVDLSAWGAYLKAKMNAGPAYFGALFAYASGDDGSDPAESKANPGGCGPNFAPALILMNDALATWTNSGSTGAGNSSKFNVIIYNAFAGFNPTPKLNVEAALTYADVDKIPVGVTRDKNMGMEFDVKATYKIYDNLSYMVGAGYLWTGDYFKGVGGATPVDNDYILLNQLTLSF
jgi:hypothetical protein